MFLSDVYGFPKDENLPTAREREKKYLREELLPTSFARRPLGDVAIHQLRRVEMLVSFQKGFFSFPLKDETRETAALWMKKIH